MNLDCQPINERIRHFLWLMAQVVGAYEFTHSSGGYTAAMASRKDAAKLRTAADIFGERIRTLRGRRTLREIDVKAGLGTSKLSKLERGVERNPRLETLIAVARGLDTSVAHLFIDESVGPHAENSARDPHFVHPALQSFVDRFSEQPAPGSWQSDVIDAIAALTRALQRRDDAGAAADRPAKIGR